MAFTLKCPQLLIIIPILQRVTIASHYPRNASQCSAQLYP